MPAHNFLKTTYNHIDYRSFLEIDKYIFWQIFLLEILYESVAMSCDIVTNSDKGEVSRILTENTWNIPINICTAVLE